MTPDHYTKLRNMYLGANFNKRLYESTTCLIEEKKATISLNVTDKYHHALGAMHGSVYFKMLDDAAFFAVNSIVTDVFVLTTEFNIKLLRPVSSGVITAIGSVTKESDGVFVAEAKLYNENNKIVSRGKGHFVKSKVELSEEIGYV